MKQACPCEGRELHGTGVQERVKSRGEKFFACVIAKNKT